MRLNLRHAVLVLLLCAVAVPAAAQEEGSLDRRVRVLEQKLSGQGLTAMVNNLNDLSVAVNELRGRIQRLDRQLAELKSGQEQLSSQVERRLDKMLTTLDERQTKLNKRYQGAMRDVVAEFKADARERSEAVDQRLAAIEAELGIETPRASGADAPAGSGSAAARDGESQDQPAEATANDPEGGAGTRSDGASSAGSGEGGGEAGPSNTGSMTEDRAAAEKQTYNAAFETLRKGNYAAARDQFQTQLDRFPNGEYADNARYWTGESYYVVRDFEAAKQAFRQVLDLYPESSKRSAALLKIGFIEFERDNLDAARSTLQKVVSDFPDSAAADRARQRLENIDSGGG